MLYTGENVLQRILSGIAAGDPDALLAKGWFDAFYSEWNGVLTNWKTGVDSHIFSMFKSIGKPLASKKFVNR